MHHNSALGNSINSQAMAQQGYQAESDRQPEVIAALERLDRLSYSLADLVSSFGDRLSMVTRPELAEQKGQGTLVAHGAPLAGHVVMITDRIESQMSILGSILSRLEI